MIKLRKAEFSECTYLHGIQLRSFQFLLEKYQDFDTNPAAETLQKIQMRFVQKHTDYYLILNDEQVVGMLRVCDYGAACRLSPICILPEYRGRGFATRAILEMERYYPNAEYWELDTILQEDSLCRLYENLGYVRTGKYHTIRDGMDLVFYRKYVF